MPHNKTHASEHTNGTDDIQSATASVKGLATAAQITKLDGIVGSIKTEVFTVDGIWTKPANFLFADVIMINGGGGGGSGRKGATGTDRTGGAGGGGGGLVSVMHVPNATIPGASQGFSVGAGGAGGAAVSTDSTDGNYGSVGGNSSWGPYSSYAPFPGGGGGQGGNTSLAVGGGIGIIYTDDLTRDWTHYINNVLHDMSGGALYEGGYADILQNNSPTPKSMPVRGPTSGGAGACTDAGESIISEGFGGGAGAASFAPGQDITAEMWCGHGGNGGASGVDGLAGFNYGSGGGGGGDGTDAAQDSGAGGAGADGVVVVISYLSN